MRPRRARLDAIAPCAGTRRTRASAPTHANSRLASKTSPRHGTPHAQSRAAAHKRSICPTASATRPLLSPRMPRAMHSSGWTCTFHRTNPKRTLNAFQPTPIRIPNKIRMVPLRSTSRDSKTRMPSPTTCLVSLARKIQPQPKAPGRPHARPARHHRTHTLTSSTFRLWCFLLSDYGSPYFQIVG